MKLIHIDQGSEESKQRVQVLIDAYNKSSTAQKQKNTQPTIVAMPDNKEKEGEYAADTLSQISLLSKRNFVDTTREPLK